MKSKHKGLKKPDNLRNPVAHFMNEVNRAATYVDRKKTMKTRGVGRRGKWVDVIALTVA